MDKRKKPIIIAGAGIATVLIAYYVYDLLKTQSEIKKLDDPKPKPLPKSTAGQDEIISMEAQASNDAYPLKVGSYGAKVYVLQDALNKLGAGLTVDGKFGQKTYTAVTNITAGFGALNILCKLDYGCTLTYDNWTAIIKKAEEKGFNINVSWTSAKKIWKA
jgi:hypothetical protein